MSHADSSTLRRVCNAAALVLAAHGAGPLGATGHEVAPAARTVAAASDRSLPDLEEAFWACDHAATVSGVIDARTAMACGAATEDLRLRRFNGDFAAMLSWWKQHKPAQHRALDEEMWRATRAR